MRFVRLLGRGFLYFAIVLSVWEVCARVEDKIRYGVPLLGTNRYTDMLTYDEFGIAGKPHGHYLNYELNSLGFRGPEPRWDRDRIICIGASETIGLNETPGMEFPRQLERELNAHSTEQYSVVNTGIPGQRLGSFARRVDKVVAQVDPKMAVIYPAPSGYIDPPSPHSEDWLPQHPSPFELRIMGQIFEPLERMPPWVKMARMKFKIWRKTRRIAVMDKIPSSRIDLFRQDLTQVLDKLQQRGVRPILVTHATRFGPGGSPAQHLWLVAWRTWSPNLAEGGFLDMEARINDVIRQEAASRGITLVDAAKTLHGPENFTDFVHFSDLGAHGLACAIAEEIDKPGSIAAIAARASGPTTDSGGTPTSTTSALQKDRLSINKEKSFAR